MNSVFLFDTISQNNRWLTQRQAVVAQNVANASTPGFKSMDVKPFEDVLNNAGIAMARTDKAHLAIEGPAGAEAAVEEETLDQALHSGNNVGLEREFAKSGEIGRSYALNTNIIKSFNRMLQLSLKG